MKTGRKFLVADEDCRIDEVLGSLDPNQSAMVTFVVTPGNENGGYVVEFDRDEQFEDDFPIEVIS